MRLVYAGMRGRHTTQLGPVRLAEEEDETEPRDASEPPARAANDASHP
jgi:hypothetical protein